MLGRSRATKITVLCLILVQWGISASAGNEQDTASSVRRCLPGEEITAALWNFAQRGDEESFSTLFQLLNRPLAEAIEGQYRLGGDNAEEVASVVLMKLWEREIQYPGESWWKDDFSFSWLTGQAKNYVRRAEVSPRGKNQVNTVNVTPDHKRGDDYDMLGNSGASTHTDMRLSQTEINLLPDALHRMVLMRVIQGKKTEEIAQELNRSVATTQGILREARHSLSELLKGREPVAKSRFRDSWLMGIVQDALEKETEIRPVLMGEGAITLTEARLFELMSKYSDQSRQIAYKYFIEGKRQSDIVDEMGVKRRAVNAVVEHVRELVGKHHLPPDSKVPSTDQVWIVDDQGVPVTRYRQLDFAPKPKDPIEVSGRDFWHATKDWNLKFQQVAKMRYVEGLSNNYISKTAGIAQGVVDRIVQDAAKLVAEKTKNPKITVTNLALTGDTSMVHTTAVEIPAKVYFRALELENDPSERAKLRVAQEISGLPVDNLPRIILIDENRQPIINYDHQSHFVPPYSGNEPVKITTSNLQVAMSRVSEQDAKVLDLYLRHRWSVSSLANHLNLTGEEVRKAIERGGTQLERELGVSNIRLSDVVVTEQRGRTNTTQLDVAEFKARLRAQEDQTVEGAKRMVLAWKNRKVTHEQPMELVDAENRPIFTYHDDFLAPEPSEPTTMRLADFESALAQSRLSDEDIRIMRLRFVDGWGSAGITHLFDIPKETVREALARGIFNLNRVSQRNVAAPNLKIIPSGRPQIQLTRFAVNYDRLLWEARETNDFSRENLRNIAARMARRPTLQLEQVTLVGEDGRPALALNEEFTMARPENARVISVPQMEMAVTHPEQRLALQLRYQHRYTQAVIGRILGKDARETKNLLNAGLWNLRNQIAEDIQGGNLSIELPPLRIPSLGL